MMQQQQNPMRGGADGVLKPMATIESQHEDMIHDCQFDYYSKKLATCSSDRTIKIFDVTGDLYHNSATLTGHEGPIWQIGWAHPKFGVLLASCSYDGSVIIHREGPPGNWVRAFEHKFHESSVNSVSWAPHEFGLVLACASSDGRVSILEHKNGSWGFKFFQNDSMGCNSVSWAPYSSSYSHAESDGSLIRRLATGSCDNLVRIWRSCDGGGEDGSWNEEKKVDENPHSNWVRDVAFAPNGAIPYTLFASCSEDCSVYIWKPKADSGAPPSRSSAVTWEPTLLKVFDAPVWRVSWSITGSVLSISTGDHNVSLWKQSVTGAWMQISSLDEQSGADLGGAAPM